MGVVACHHLDGWDDYPLIKMLACARSTPMGLGKDPELIELRHAIRALIPTDLPIQKDGVVIIRPGEGAPIHAHARTWAAAYCVDHGGSAPALVVDGIRYVPERGSVTVINPGVPHQIELNEGERDRVSFVLLVGDDPRRRPIDSE